MFYLLNFDKNHYDRNRPVLYSYDKKYSEPVLLKGAGLSRRFLINLKHINRMQDKKLVLKKQRNRYYDNPIKG